MTFCVKIDSLIDGGRVARDLIKYLSGGIVRVFYGPSTQKLLWEITRILSDFHTVKFQLQWKRHWLQVVTSSAGDAKWKEIRKCEGSVCKEIAFQCNILRLRRKVCYDHVQGSAESRLLDHGAVLLSTLKLHCLEITTLHQKFQNFIINEIDVFNYRHIFHTWK